MRVLSVAAPLDHMSCSFVCRTSPPIRRTSRGRQAPLRFFSLRLAFPEGKKHYTFAHEERPVHLYSLANNNKQARKKNLLLMMQIVQQPWRKVKHGEDRGIQLRGYVRKRIGHEEPPEYPVISTDGDLYFNELENGLLDCVF